MRLTHKDMWYLKKLVLLGAPAMGHKSEPSLYPELNKFDYFNTINGKGVSIMKNA